MALLLPLAIHGEAVEWLGDIEQCSAWAFLESDPRVDISHTQTVSRVGKGGVPYDPPTLFDALLDSPGNRVSDNPVRMLIGGGALLLTLLLLAGGVRKRRRSLA